METWEELNKWADDTAKEHSIKILRDSNISDDEIMRDLNLTNEEFTYFTKKIAEN